MMKHKCNLSMKNHVPSPITIHAMFIAELAYTQFLGLSNYQILTITIAKFSYPNSYIHIYKQIVIWVGWKTSKSKFLFHSYRTRICKCLHHEINQKWGLKLEIVPTWKMQRIYHEYAWSAFTDQISDRSQAVLTAKPDTQHNIKVKMQPKMIEECKNTKSWWSISQMRIYFLL